MKGEAISLYPFYHFHLLQRYLAGLLLQRSHLYALLAVGIKFGTFGTCSLEFTLSTLTLVAAVVTRILKTRVTLGNVSCVLLNLTKRFHVPPNTHAVNSHIFSLVYQLQLLLALTFILCLICLLSVVICIFSWEELIYWTFEDCIGLFNSHYCSFFCLKISTS